MCWFVFVHVSLGGSNKTSGRIFLVDISIPLFYGNLWNVVCLTQQETVNLESDTSKLNLAPHTERKVNHWTTILRSRVCGGGTRRLTLLLLLRVLFGRGGGLILLFRSSFQFCFSFLFFFSYQAGSKRWDWSTCQSEGPLGPLEVLEGTE